MASNGAVYILITNSGKMDEMLLMNNKLKERLDVLQRENGGQKDDSYYRKANTSWYQNTHVVPFDRTYRPYITFGSEYQPVEAAGGQSTSQGGTLSYSLPVYGDFFHDIVFKASYPALEASKGSLPALEKDIIALPATGTELPKQTITLPDGTQYDTVSAAAKRFSTVQWRYLDKETGQYLKPENAATLAADANQRFDAQNYQDYVRWCDFPGEKHVKKYSFTINGNPIDDYDRESYIFHRNKFVSKDKKDDWYQCVGQQTPKHMESDFGGKRVTTEYYDGYQTPKLRHEKLTMHTPLLFWFCKELDQSFLSTVIPYGQRFVKVELEEPRKLYAKAARYEKVAIVTEYVYTGTGALTETATGVEFPAGAGDFADYDVSRQSYVAEVYSSGVIQQVHLSQHDMIVNNIFVDADIHENYVGKQLNKMIKIHMNASKPIPMGVTDHNLLIPELKFPVEHICVGVQYDDETSDDFQM